MICDVIKNESDDAGDPTDIQLKLDSLSFESDVVEISKICQGPKFKIFVTVYEILIHRKPYLVLPGIFRSKKIMLNSVEKCHQ